MTSPPTAEIIGLGVYAPPTVVTNQDLTRLMDTTDEWIQTRTGIRQRRSAHHHQGTSDLAVEAASAALKDAGVSPKDIDLIIACTTTPDYYMPGIGVLVQDKLGCKQVGAIDVRGQCSGFTWGLSVADAYARTGNYHTILMVGADLQTRLLDYSLAGRNTAVLFGDGAGACVIASHCPVSNNTERMPHSGLVDHVLGSDGSGCHSLFLPRPGSAAYTKNFISQEDLQEKKNVPHMDGRQVFKHATHYMEKVVRDLLSRNRLTTEDIDLIVPHQANRRIHEMLRAKLELPEEKMVSNIDKYGNTTSATIPLCLEEARQDGRLKKGSLIITASFGSGFTWGGNLIRW